MEDFMLQEISFEKKKKTNRNAESAIQLLPYKILIKRRISDGAFIQFPACKYIAKYGAINSHSFVDENEVMMTIAVNQTCGLIMIRHHQYS